MMTSVPNCLHVCWLSNDVCAHAKVEAVKHENECCPAYAAIQLLQEKWVLHIVRTLLRGPHGFNELGREIGGCNPTTLTQRLVRLEGAGLVSRHVQSRMPPRCTYQLSESGRALEGVIDAIDGWARHHLEEDEVVSGNVGRGTGAPVLAARN